jgi:hypothetical protein
MSDGIVRVFVRELGTKAAYTIRNEGAHLVDFVGSFRLALYGVYRGIRFRS